MLHDPPGDGEDRRRPFYPAAPIQKPTAVFSMPADLLTSPRWNSDHLGLPMPDDRDAVSACLPLWEHNIAYEEGDANVIDRLQAAYPRFCIHPDVRRLCASLFAGGSGLPFVTATAGTRAVEYVCNAGGTTAKVHPIAGQSCVAVSVEEQEFPLLKQYWQHSGELISSRVARSILDNRPATFKQTEARAIVRKRVAELHQVSDGNVFLFSSGMGAISCAWRAIHQLSPEKPTCQFGFPYVDTLKIQERFPGARHSFLPFGNSSDVQELAELFPTHRFSAVFCETPANPLLVTPDISQLRTVTRKNNAVFVIDDTLRACSRQSMLPQCDVVVTSLTKYFSGYGNVLAGALVLNPSSNHFEKLNETIRNGFEETLSDADTLVLEQNSRDLASRVGQCVANAQVLADRLHQHPGVESVYYPGSSATGATSCGALFSIVLKDAEKVTPRVFDRLEVSKGPNLGTNFTLCCPYTILAHYNELDFAEHCGASRWLLRFSIGTEPVEDLWQRLTTALKLAE
jgi:cystathionine gamma-synthase